MDYVTAARTSDGATVMAYLPNSRTITVDMSSEGSRWPGQGVVVQSAHGERYSRRRISYAWLAGFPSAGGR